MRPALDRLSKIPLSERWTNPDLLKIRELGPRAIPLLRSVLREKETASVRTLLWMKAKWPKLTKRFSFIPDIQLLSERRWTACQVLESLGPTARPAVPDLVAILIENDPREVNGVMMVLWKIGLDVEICDRLDEVLEKYPRNFGSSSIISCLATVKPPAARTTKVLLTALKSPLPYIQAHAAETLGQLGVASPEIVSGLKVARSSSTSGAVIISCSSALWDLEKDDKESLDPIFKCLGNELKRFVPSSRGGGDGGQGVDGAEQNFLRAAGLFEKMKLKSPEREAALSLLQTFAEEKSKRIFVRMLLLRGMIELGYPTQKCIEVCRDGLGRSEDYYRLQAAGLLTLVAEKRSSDDLNEATLLDDANVGVRVFAAKIHWLKHHDAQVVVPVLVEALDRSKYQSYNYSDIQAQALGLLGEIGLGAKSALPTIEALALDPNAAVVKLASEVRIKINNGK